MKSDDGGAVRIRSTVSDITVEMWPEIHRSDSWDRSDDFCVREKEREHCTDSVGLETLF